MQFSKTRKTVLRRLGLVGCSAITLLAAGAANADPMATPAISPPLAANANPSKFEAGPLGDV